MGRERRGGREQRQREREIESRKEWEMRQMVSRE